MDNIDMEKFILLVEAHECIWKNSSINAGNLTNMEAAWRSVAFSVYENFDDLKENQKKFWVNNLKRKWKLISSKFKALGEVYEHFKLLQFMTKPSKLTAAILNSESVVNYNAQKISSVDESNVTSNFINSDITYTEPIKCGEIFLEHGSYFYKCVICDLSFDVIDSFGGHINEIHNLPSFKEIKTEKMKEIADNENIEYLIEEESIEANIKQELGLEGFDNKSKSKTNNVYETNVSNDDYVEEVAYNEFQEIDSYDEIQNKDQAQCPHCTILFQSSNEHDVDRCFQIQEKILKLNGDLRALRDEGIYHCDCCSRYFGSADKMYKHRREEHYEICPVCKIRLLNVENHVISHHNEIDYKKLKIPHSFSSGTFICKLCDKVFIQKDLWMRHKNKCSNSEIENKKKIQKLV